MFGKKFGICWAVYQNNLLDWNSSNSLRILSNDRDASSGSHTSGKPKTLATVMHLTGQSVSCNKDTTKEKHWDMWLVFFYLSKLSVKVRKRKWISNRSSKDRQETGLAILSFSNWTFHLTETLSQALQTSCQSLFWQQGVVSITTAGPWGLQRWRVK